MSEHNGPTAGEIEQANAAIERLIRAALDPSGKSVTVDLTDLRHALVEIIRLRHSVDHNVDVIQANTTLFGQLKRAADGLLVSVRGFHAEAQRGTPSAHALKCMVDAAEVVDGLLRKVGRA